MRVTTSSRSDVRSTVVSFLTASSPPACGIRLLLSLDLINELIQLHEPLFPDAPVAIEPFVKLLHRLHAWFVEPLLRARPRLHHSRGLEDREVLGTLRLPQPEPATD